MTLTKAGGLAALVCAGTYIFGFVFLVTVFAPLGFGTGETDVPAVVAYIADRPGVMIAWNTTIYIVNALALTVLVVALHRRIASERPDAAALAGAIGLIWATLVLGAGMIANVAVEQVHALAADPEAAAELWLTLQAVELGLGGGNEIAGGAWILVVSLAALASGIFGRITAGIGAVSGFAGLVTILPPLGETAGAVFGLGAIAWFVAVGLVLLRGSRTTFGRGLAA
ncbi:hypothetical protein OG2516_05628 [Oceanicola granulosus HTCC2516]|uniref:DUF4386 family protein n=1 Tax=Oceanicola granulosus (strain ATCC BAA-861 / DSM 15982 / KCTC 12143 / HTCC2516) TaxID=314256 RepID=Q2CIM6_OCEGH|nr:DUF4386 family protein [Oceanicola granulosus]EAR52563.1 hypothetical protein OG2516_05628 [Oceanicola granulosus HTCC2516]